MSQQQAQSLTWGQRVQITDETHACFGRVGQYEGVICEDAMRVRFPTGVIVCRDGQLCAVEDPVCSRRRIAKSGARPIPAHRIAPRPAFDGDYGKTELELATDAWLASDNDTGLDAVFRIQSDAMRQQRIRRHLRARAPRATE